MVENSIHKRGDLNVEELLSATPKGQFITDVTINIVQMSLFASQRNKKIFLADPIPMESCLNGRA